MIITKPESQFGLIDWWKKVVRDNYANFDGRARRAEYWNFVLANFLINIGLYLLFILLAFSGILAFLSIGVMLVLVVYAVAMIIPSLSVLVRRLHDTDKSGWFALLGLIPIGNIVLFVFLVIEGTHGTNQYGNDPKIAPDFINEIGTKEY